ncbi:MAG: amidohydrolase family protein, partial [Oscillospiraceae bacterium]
MSSKVLKCGKLFDSENEKVLENVLVFVKENKVEKVCPYGAATEGYEVIDLSDKFVTPGLMDCHVHLTSNGEADFGGEHRTLGDLTLFAMRTAQADLMAGFTSLRSVGDAGFVDVALRDAINRGEVMGPRLMVSGPCLGTTGGHADDHFNPYISNSQPMGNIGDGPVELMKAARYNIKHGVDLIKFMSTGGVMSKGTEVGAQQMNFEEMKA